MRVLLTGKSPELFNWTTLGSNTIQQQVGVAS